MNKNWMLFVFVFSTFLLACLKTHQVLQLRAYVPYRQALKLQSFQERKNNLSPGDQDLLEVWESMLTGRSAPLSKSIRDAYSSLGIGHIFTPSGFHLSALVSPFMKFFRNQTHQLVFLFFVGVGLSFAPGFGALKRMVLVKGAQKKMGSRLGLGFAFLLDVLFGTFQTSPLSFTMSFLFLGIIYSGTRGRILPLWFFLGQILLAFFQDKTISVLLLFWNPILNFFFGIILAPLFLLSFPLWDWQVYVGLLLLKGAHGLALLAATTLRYLPTVEIHCGILVVIVALLLRKRKITVLWLSLLSGSLNLEQAARFPLSKYEVGMNGRCRAKVQNGYLIERCLPLRTFKRQKVRRKKQNPRSDEFRTLDDQATGKRG